MKHFFILFVLAITAILAINVFAFNSIGLTKKPSAAYACGVPHAIQVVSTTPSGTVNIYRIREVWGNHDVVSTTTNAAGDVSVSTNAIYSLLLAITNTLNSSAITCNADGNHTFNSTNSLNSTLILPGDLLYYDGTATGRVDLIIAD